MSFEELRAVWLVLRREYLERVKSFSFLASTFAAPALFLALAATPALFAAPRLITPKPIVVVCAAGEPARQIAELFGNSGLMHYRAEIVTDATPKERARLTAMVRQSRIEGFLWLDQTAIDSGRVEYTSQSGLDAIGRLGLRGITSRAVIRTRLAGHGLSSHVIDRSLQPVTVDVISLRSEAGKKGSDGETAAMLVTVMVITILEMSLLSYGIIVMRSVLEDKTSRMVEILLCSVTPRALMAGKVLGIGGLSLTQVMLWGVMAMGGVTIVSRVFGVNLGSSLMLSAGALGMLALFYVLGYLLYSSVYAAAGAAFNTADEGQYWSFVLTLPLLFGGIAAWSLVERPDSGIAVGMSLFPPLAPVMMTMRMVVGAAPGWQIGLSLMLMAAAIYLPTITTPDQVDVNDGTLAEVHESTQRVLLDQIRQGILADRLGFNYLFMTEHHSQPEGAEFSPNPLLAETAIAARTSQIRLGQAATRKMRMARSAGARQLQVWLGL